MKRHLTERELIEYRFKLASDKRVGASAEHLAGCAECLKRLRSLNSKFAAMDLLREDIHVSEESISQAVAQARRPVQTKVVPFNKYRWAGAVAAVLVVGLVILIGSLSEKEPRQPEFAEGSKSSEGQLHDKFAYIEEKKPDSAVRIVAKAPESGPELPLTGDLAKGEVATRTFALNMQKDTASVRRRSLAGIGAGAAAQFATEPISQQPPFAPAGAIELVTLPRRDRVQLTIYNSADLTLVRERRNLTLKKGWNWLQFMWANTLIDPTSLSLEPLEQTGRIDIQQLVFPARLRELGRWLIRSEISGQVPFEITYFTSGLSWRAFYMGTLSQDEKAMRLQGYVRVGNNSGEDYEKAQTRLIVGQVHILDEIAELARRQYAYGRPMPSVDSGGGVLGGFGGFKGQAITNGRLGDLYGAFDAGVIADRPKEIKKEGLSEYFLYTIEGTETIPNEWGKRLLSFDIEDIEIESLYKYDEERRGQQTIRFVSFANDEEHNLGETPIPNGQVKIYGQADGEGYLSYVGGTDIKYIPVDEEVELNLGPARLVKVEPKLMNFKTDNYAFDNKGNVAGWDEIRTWKIELANTRTLPIQIEITRGFGTAYWKLRADVPYKKYDVTHVRFELTPEAASKRTFEYTVTTYHGTREESLTQ